MSQSTENSEFNFAIGFANDFKFVSQEIFYVPYPLLLSSFLLNYAVVAA